MKVITFCLAYPKLNVNTLCTLLFYNKTSHLLGLFIYPVFTLQFRRPYGYLASLIKAPGSWTLTFFNVYCLCRYDPVAASRDVSINRIKKFLHFYHLTLSNGLRKIFLLRKFIFIFRTLSRLKLHIYHLKWLICICRFRNI